MVRPIFTIIVLSLLTVLLYSPLHAGNFKQTSLQHRVLILIPHPDDDCLFFAPTILALNKANTEIYSLSLSTETQMVPSARGNITKATSYSVYQLIVIGSSTALGSGTILLHLGILELSVKLSDYPNHISLPYGIAQLIQTFYALDNPIPRLYTLTTVPTLAKCMSILAPFIAEFNLILTQSFDRLYTISGVGRPAADRIPQAFAREGISSSPSRAPIFVSGIPEWFRWLYVLLSRYMWVNDWLEV
ncbi:hypothetical protein AN958_01679 [Leucoagaricus sp. SymC.cos]|nr:hypothetical protein AN958_01679 [Leucoagaricus sp. SymC.cos]